MLTGENGLLKQAVETKEKTEIAGEKEKVEMAAQGARTKNLGGEILHDDLDNELKAIIGEGEYTLIPKRNAIEYVVKYTGSNRQYVIDSKGKTMEEIEMNGVVFDYEVVWIEEPYIFDPRIYVYPKYRSKYGISLSANREYDDYVQIILDSLPEDIEKRNKEIEKIIIDSVNYVAINSIGDIEEGEEFTTLKEAWKYYEENEGTKFDEVKQDIEVETINNIYEKYEWTEWTLVERVGRFSEDYDRYSRTTMTYKCSNGQEFSSRIRSKKYFYDLACGEKYTITVLDEFGNSASKEIKIEDKYQTFLEKAKKLGQDINYNKDVGIGTDGNVVNLDLWYYECDGFSANLKRNTDLGNYHAPALKENAISEDGTLIGTVPQYIYTKYDGKKIHTNRVTTMYETFYGLTNLIKAPEIPNTVYSINGIFRNCSNLVTAPTIPERGENMSYAFNNCTSLTSTPNISDSVTNMDSAFEGCTSLISVSNIPKSVTNMKFTFNGCTNLTGNIVINANNLELTYACFKSTTKPITLTGTCPKLAELAATATNGNVTVGE